MKNKICSMRKLTSIILTVLMFAMCFYNTAFAHESVIDNKMDDVDFNTKIYNSIIDDYLLQTGLTQEQADTIFNEVKSAQFSQILSSTAKSISEIDKTADYADNVLFIQENYNDIVKGLSMEDKYVVDKYFLVGALQYYRDYADVNEFEDEDYLSPTSLFTPIEPIRTEQSIPVSNQASETETQMNNAVRATNAVAEVRIFSDSSGESSIINTSGHAWLTVKNISSSNITVGKFSIQPNKTITLGTWGNTDEHHGLWYSLEAYNVYKQSAWSDRVSLLVEIDSTALSTLTSHIINYDKWSITNNCSSFAVKGWNKICSTTLSAGVINTPTNLKNSIVNTGLSSTGIAVPYDYVVYYANGSNTPIRSSVFK
jgi:methionine-rich copper-binding protein CopC